MERTRKSYETTAAVERHDNDFLRPGEEVLFRTLHGRVLDIGCGTGRTTAYISKTCDVVGIDYSKAMIAKARENHSGLTFEVMDVRDLKFPPTSFDCAYFSFGGLDHLYPFAERINALKEIRRVLKTGGLFAYTTHTSTTKAPWWKWKGHLYAFAHGIQPPYRVNYTSYGPLVIYRAPENIQTKTLNETGFKLKRTIPVREGEVMMICEAT